MAGMTRRAFLEASPGALGALAFAPPDAGAAQPARMYTVLFRTAPSEDDTGLRPMGHEEILARLRRECDGVEFVVRDLTRDGRLPAVLEEMRDLARLQCDGVLLYGARTDYRLLRSGLPTIAVAVVNDFMDLPYAQFHRYRTVPAQLDPWRYSADPAVAERMWRDLVEKIRLVRALRRMRSEHILTVTDSPYLNVIYGDVLQNPPPNYNQTVLEAIASTFGTRVTKIGTREVTSDQDIRGLWSGESAEANEIARRWMRNAQKTTFTIEAEVVQSAKLYLAMKILLAKYNATAMAFHIRTLVPEPRPEDNVYPALATSEFQLANMVVKCQSHLNVVLSEMLLQYAYRRPSMLGDYSVDPYHGVSMVQHCEGPWNPWGDERRVPYILTDHRERRARGRSVRGGGAASWVLYPPGEPVTMWQLEVLNREVLLHTGTTVPMLTGPVKFRDHLWEMM